MEAKTRELIQKGFDKIKAGKLPNKREIEAIKTNDTMVQIAYIYNRIYELRQEREALENESTTTN
jgi:hypothetical protein